MSAVTPVSPTVLRTKLINSIPDFVVNIVNNLLAERYTGNGRIVILNKQVQELIFDHMKKHNMPINNITEVLTKTSYMNFMILFKDKGWDITTELTTAGPAFIFTE